MGYLFLELFLFLLGALLLGLLIGYWIWGGKGDKSLMLEQDLANANKALEDCQSARQRLEREESATRTKLSDAKARIVVLEEALAAAKEEAEAAPEPTPAPVAPVAPVASVAQPDEEAKAKLALSPFLEKPVGEPDNLRTIKGVGPKLNTLLHTLGVFHFFQIAGWSPEDVAKVDAELSTFKGRIERDNWIEQAKLLADGDMETFTARFGQLGDPKA